MRRDRHFDEGAVARVPAILERMGARSVFLVTGRTSYRACGAEVALREGLGRLRTVRWTVSRPNPSLQSIEAGLAAFLADRCDVVVAVGGGSVLDTAKLIAALSAQSAPPLSIVRGERQIEGKGPPLIAVPTTAGSGSEATHFAVAYVDHHKHSVAHETMRPDFVVVDPELTYSLSPHQTAVTGFDALSQAVESMWSIRSDDHSSALAREAIGLALANLEEAVHQPARGNRTGMCRASHLAGRAIDVTRTTAPHALSYAMTSRFGVPHGHAVALTLGPALVYNAAVTADDVRDRRGADHVRQTIDNICAGFDRPDPGSAAARFRDLMTAVGLATRLCEVGIATQADRRYLVDQVNVERLGNNPRDLSADALWQLINSIA